MLLFFYEKVFSQDIELMIFCYIEAGIVSLAPMPKIYKLFVTEVVVVLNDIVIFHDREIFQAN